MICPDLKKEAVLEKFNEILERLGGRRMYPEHVTSRKAWKLTLDKDQEDAYYRTYKYWNDYKGDTDDINRYIDSLEGKEQKATIEKKLEPQAAAGTIKVPAPERLQASDVGDGGRRTPPPVLSLSGSIDDHISWKPKDQKTPWLTFPERIYTGLKELATPILKIQKEFESATGSELPDRENIQFAINRVRGSAGTAKVFIQDYFEPIWRDIPIKKRGTIYSETMKYTVCKRTVWLYDNKKGYIDAGLNRDAAQDFVNMVESGEHPFSNTILEKAQKMWDYSGMLKDIKLGHGIIDDQLYESLNDPNYVPFYRDIESGKPSKAPSTSLFTSTSKGIRRIKGSLRGAPIIDPGQSLIQQTYETITNAARADVMNIVIDIVESPDAPEELKDVVKKLPPRWRKANSVALRVEIDAELRPAIEKIINDLGVDIEYRARVKGKPGMGISTGRYVPEDQKTQLIYSSTEDTAGHELGHIIYDKRGWYKSFVERWNEELNLVSESRFEGEEVPLNMVAYTKTADEKAAEFISLYLTAREKLSAMMPDAVAYFEDQIAEDDQLRVLKETVPSNISGIREYEMDNWILDNTIPRDEDVVSVLREGKLVSYRVPIELAQAVKNLNAESVPWLMKLLVIPTRLLRAGAVGYNLDFAIPNAIRDQADAALTAGTIPVVDFFLGLKHYYAQDEYYKEYMRRGGGMESPESGAKGLHTAIGQAVYGLRAERFLDPYYWKTHGIIESASDISAYFVQTPFRAIRDVVDAFEMATRLGIYGRAIEKNAPVVSWLTGKGGVSPDAAVQLGRSSTLDFQRFGNLIKTPNSIIPFLNAGIEGVDVAARRFKQAVKDPKKFGWRFALRALSYGIIPMIGLFLWNRKNKYYKTINDNEKINNWIIMSDEDSPNYNKIPKGHVIKLIVNPAQMIIEKSYGTSVGDAKDIAWGIYQTVTPLPGVSDIPPALKLFLEPIANYDYYWNQAIEKPAMKAFPPGSRFNRTTSESLKKIGFALNISPIMMQHQINTVFAGTGRNMLFVADLVTGEIDWKNISSDRLPIVKRFMAQTEEWKSEIDQKLNEVNKRLSEMEKVSPRTIVKSYGYKPEEIQKALKARAEEHRKLIEKRIHLVEAKDALGYIDGKTEESGKE